MEKMINGYNLCFTDEVIKEHCKIINERIVRYYKLRDMYCDYIEIIHDKNMLTITVSYEYGGYYNRTINELTQKFCSVGKVSIDKYNANIIHIDLDVIKIYLLNSKRVFSYLKINECDSKEEIYSDIEYILALGIDKNNIIFDIEKSREHLYELISNINRNDLIIINNIVKGFDDELEVLDLIHIAYNKKFTLIVEDYVFDINTDINPQCICEKIKAVQELYISKKKSLKIKKGMECSKNYNTSIGRPKSNISTIPETFLENYKLLIQGEINMSQLAQISGISRPTAYKYKNLIESYNYSLYEV